MSTALVPVEIRLRDFPLRARFFDVVFQRGILIVVEPVAGGEKHVNRHCIIPFREFLLVGQEFAIRAPDEAGRRHDRREKASRRIPYRIPWKSPAGPGPAGLRGNHVFYFSGPSTAIRPMVKML